MGSGIGKRTGLVVGLVLAGLTSGTARGELITYAFSGYLTEVHSVLNDYETNPPTPKNFLPGVTVGSTFSGTLTFDLGRLIQEANQGIYTVDSQSLLSVLPIDNNLSAYSIVAIDLFNPPDPAKGLSAQGMAVGGGDSPVPPYLLPDQIEGVGLTIGGNGTGTLGITIRRISNLAPGEMLVSGNVTSFVAVPEPSSLVLGVVGLGTAAAGRAWRRRGRAKGRGTPSDSSG